MASPAGPNAPLHLTTRDQNRLDSEFAVADESGWTNIELPEGLDHFKQDPLASGQVLPWLAVVSTDRCLNAFAVTRVDVPWRACAHTRSHTRKRRRTVPIKRGRRKT